jgi:hypothetical protein
MAAICLNAALLAIHGTLQKGTRPNPLTGGTFFTAR